MILGQGGKMQGSLPWEGLESEKHPRGWTLLKQPLGAEGIQASFSSFFPLPGLGPRALHTLGKCSTSELHCQPLLFVSDYEDQRFLLGLPLKELTRTSADTMGSLWALRTAERPVTVDSADKDWMTRIWKSLL
jgi:hypothetical protein